MSKMKNGVVQRGTTWSYVVREFDPASGKSKPVWRGGCRTQAEAKAKRAEAIAAMAKGTYVARQDITVGQYLRTWIDGHEVELKPSTARSYRSKIEVHLIPAIGYEKVQALTPSRLSVVFKTMLEQGGRGAIHGKGGQPLSPRTVEFARAVLRKAMQDAIVERLIDVNPVVGSKRPKPVKPQHTTWTAEQVRLFLEHEAGSRLYPMWVLAFATGMRRGELMGLVWSDIDLDLGTVAVNRSAAQLGQERIVTTPKNRERRRVAIDPATTLVMRTWKIAQAQEKLACGQDWTESGATVFTWEDGRPLLPDYVSKRFQHVQAQLVPALPRIVLHEIRHSHATILLRSGVPVHVVSKRLGHRDVTITLNVYADVLPEDDDRAVATWTRALTGQ